MKRHVSVTSKLLCLLMFGALIAIPSLALADALATPVLVSPLNKTHFEHFPRATTVAWERVTGATGYRVVVQFFSGNTWTNYKNEVITGGAATSYTFNFVGDQPGRWRVMALDDTGTHTRSAFSTWRQFSYATSLQMTTPILVSPANNTHFQNYPRKMTLAWEPVAFASGYLVEVQFYFADWNDWITETVTVASHTFEFAGGQPGRWRVTALDESGVYDSSEPSPWRLFDFDI